MNEKTIYALGFFDGVHLGHQALLAACRELADQHGCQAGVVTFTVHPDGLVAGNAPRLLNTTEDRRRLLLAYGMDEVIELPFDRQLMQMPWRDFIRMLRGAPYNAAGLVCGNDFRFGYMGEGTALILQRYCKAAGMPWTVIPQQEQNGVRISSTRIRELLEDGQLEQANRLLGHPHILTGVVQTGKQLGRTIGIPTANLTFPDGIIVPKFGVYACRVSVEGKTYAAVANVGIRPTVNGEGITVEAHLLDFSGDLYGKEITVIFYEFLRPEKKFDSLEELKVQIAEDIAQVRL